MIIPTFDTFSDSSAILNSKLSSCNDLHSCRTIWNIIWSSIVTLFACVWLSVHPNIPAPEDSWGKRVARRVWIMSAVLIAPELMVGWATRQWIVASKIAEENKKYGWTKTHGFFVAMGGFMKCDKDGRPVSTVTVYHVDSIPEETKMRIAEADIQDKSKGDVLSKGFAMLQTGWFILQCISRTIEGLPVTELEIATGAFCALNVVTYILWWDKPLNVSRSVQVYSDEGMEEGAEDGGAVDEGAASGGAKKGLGRPLRTWKAFEQGLADIPKEAYRPITAAIAKKEGEFLSIVKFPLTLLYTIGGGTSFKSNPRRVGTFGPQYGDSNYRAGIMSGAVGMVFGAIHCTAWASQFPSHTEQLLWRAAAIYVTSTPLLVTLLGVAIRSFAVCSNASREFQDTSIVFIFVPVIHVYVLARLTLLVLPFMSLRSLPPGAFNSVDWIRFIPHI